MSKIEVYKDLASAGVHLSLDGVTNEFADLLTLAKIYAENEGRLTIRDPSGLMMKSDLTRLADILHGKLTIEWLTSAPRQHCLSRARLFAQPWVAFVLRRNLLADCE